MSTPAPALAPFTPADEALISRWLFGRSRHTQQAYRADVAVVLAIAGKPLAELTLDDLQAVSTRLQHPQAGTRDLAPATVARRLTGIKSLLKFAHETGALQQDVGRALRLPRRPNTLAERIVDQEAMQALLVAAETPRDRALVAVLYGGGLRVAEVVALQWRDLVRREGAGQITIREGKGGRSRVVRVPPAAWSALLAIRSTTDLEAFVFTGYKDQPLTTRQAQRVVKAAAVRAGLPEAFSPHWARHAHASHSLEAGASLRLVQETLGHSSISVTEKYLHVRPDSSSGDFLDLVEPAPAPAQQPRRGRRRP